MRKLEKGFGRKTRVARRLGILASAISASGLRPLSDKLLDTTPLFRPKLVLEPLGLRQLA